MGLAAGTGAKMSSLRYIVVVACLLLAQPVWADDGPAPLPELKDLVQKGLVGKALDVVPMDAGQRVVLQQTSAVVSGTLTARSLAAWLGVTHPLLLAAGLIWGLYSASNIKEADAGTEPGPSRVEPPERNEAVATQVTLLGHSSPD